MMRTFVFSGRANPPPSPGLASIGSCGLGRSPRRAGRQPQPPKNRPVGLLSLKVIVSASIEAWIVQAGTSNIIAIIAKASIGLATAIFVPQASPRPSVSLPSPKPNPLLPTPVRVDRLLTLLEGYNPSTAAYLISGFTYGFPLHFNGTISSFQAPNLLSALQNPDAVDAKIGKELQANRLAGPFVFPSFSPFCISPLGVVPKKTPGEFRMIHHLSFPRGSSVNDGIPAEHSSVSYSTVDDAIKLIKLAGPGCFMAKTDIKNAFRIIPISPADYSLLGMRWRDLFYFDRCMPMGCSSSCKTFETFSTAVEWIAQQKLRISRILHLLDDFLLVAPSDSQCQLQLSLFLDMCAYLGINMAPEKTCGPATTMSFAGIELDSVQSQARLPADKLVKCTSLIVDFLRRKKVSLKEVQSLTGLLNFACSVVVPGRCFLRRLIDLTVGARRSHHLIRVTREVREDLQVWLAFLQNFNGKSFFLDEVWFSSPKLDLYTDASGALGFGAIFGQKWCYGRWPESWTHLNIALLEFYPIVLSLFLWGHLMSNRCILFFTDNEALAHVINKQSCKDKSLMFFVRTLVSICLKFNIIFKAKHVPGVKNQLADALSRLQVLTFRQLAPDNMDLLPTVIPPHLQPHSWL